MTETDPQQPVDQTAFYYVNAGGVFLGAWVGAHDAPQDGEAVPFPPEDASRFRWNGAAYEPVPVIADYENAVSDWLDATVKPRKYKSIESVCTYVSSTNPQYKVEAEACIAWRDAVWDYCYAALKAVELGHRSAPTIAALLAELPQIVWPPVIEQ